MVLKNKKLRGMSLVELLAYTVILSIVTTALFQAIHFIEKMNDDLNNEQQMLNEFNLSVLKLDEFVSNNSISPSDITINCIKNSLAGPLKKAFYFEKDGDFYRLFQSDDCSSRAGIVFSTKPIFSPLDKSNEMFFQEGNVNNSVKYSFIFKSNSELKIDGTSYKKCIKP